MKGKTKRTSKNESRSSLFPPKAIKLAKPRTYSPLAYLKEVFLHTPKKFSFNSVYSKNPLQWQKKARRKLWELLGEELAPSCSTNNEKLLRRLTFKHKKKEKWKIVAGLYREMPIYIVKPKNFSPPYRTIICLHGHGNGARDVINMPANKEAKKLIDVLNYDYAIQAARKGWCAVAPELFCFGERVDYVEEARPDMSGGCEKPFLNATLVGKTLIGIRVKDIISLIDWLENSPHLFDTSNLACMGLSGGGLLTLYLSALESRIKRALISGYLTCMEDSIINIRHCSCNYVPSLAKWFDLPDIAGLIAPRQLIIQNGKKDAIFPIKSARKAFLITKQIYKSFNAENNILFLEHAGEHSFDSKALDIILK